MNKFNRPMDAFLYVLGVIVIFFSLGSAIQTIGQYLIFIRSKWTMPFAFIVVGIIVIWATSPLWKGMARDYKENGSVFKKEFKD